MAEGQVIFDTDVLVWALRGNLKAAHAINNVPHRALSIVSLMELLQGARSKMEARQIQQFLRHLQFRILPLSEPIGAAATALIAQYASTHGMQLADALIAAGALEWDDSLCTGNVKHFRPVRDLVVVAFRS